VPNQVTVEERVQAALSSSVPRIYFNSFISTLTAGDVCVVLEQNGAPVAVANMSLTVAKTLGTALAGAISFVEAHTGQSIMTSAELEKGLAAHQAGSK